MNETRFSSVIEKLVQHWRGEPVPDAALYDQFARCVTGILSPALADQVLSSPAAHRDVLAIAVEQLEERDPATRDLLYRLAAPAGHRPTVSTATAADPPDLEVLVRAAAAGAFPPGSGMHVGPSYQVAGDINSYGAGSIVGSNFGQGSAVGLGATAVGSIGSLGGSGNSVGGVADRGVAAPPTAAGATSPPAELPGNPTAPAHAANGASSTEAATITILFLGANPVDTSRLRLDQEVRGIDAALRQGSQRERFDLKQHWAVRMLDLQQALLQHRPQILHFSGHGSSQHAIFLESDSGQGLPVDGAVLARLLALFSRQLRCVVLNACYSDEQARAIAQHIDCVVGMTTAVGDQAAVRFAAAFYQALAYGADVQTAFDLGCVHVQPSSPGEESTPQLIALRGKPSEIRFTAGG